MRVLVTGASGHIGGTLASALAAAGHEVVGLSRRPVADKALSQHVQLDLGSSEACDQIRASVAPCDAVVHAAAAISPYLDDDSIALTNCLGTQQMVRLALAWGRRQIIFLSSVPVIGAPRLLPITETHPTDPRTAYHASKLFGEGLMRLAAREGLIAATLRLTSPVGPGMQTDRILSVFVRRALSGEPLKVFGHGTREQNYVDVRDVAAGLQACLEQRITGLYNIAGQKSISNAALAERCIEVLRSRSSIVRVAEPDAHENERWQVSFEKANKCFGYEPRYSIERSIATVAGAYSSSHHERQSTCASH